MVRQAVMGTFTVLGAQRWGLEREKEKTKEGGSFGTEV